jgi:hypothetical protein
VWRHGPRRSYQRQGQHNQLFDLGSLIASRMSFYGKKRKSRANLDLFRASSVAIKRHIKIKAEATPYDPKYEDYFKQRKRLKRTANSYKDQTALPKF